MGQPYEYTRVEFRTLSDGLLYLSIGLYRSDGTLKYPRLVQPPWKHVYTLRSDVSVESLFWQLKRLMASLEEGRAEPDGAPLGATGGLDTTLPFD